MKLFDFIGYSGEHRVPGDASPARTTSRKMPPSSSQLDVSRLAALGKNLGGFFDPDWYAARYPDVVASGTDPVTHFLNWGGAEARDPNRWFDSAWYAARYPDVTAAGVVPLLHYMVSGAAEHRNPHPRFDAAWYAEQHPEAAANPLLHHLLFGAARGWVTEKPIEVADYLPSTAAPMVCPRNIKVDVVVPAYRGLAETRRCLNSVLADRDRPPGRVIVVDDASPEPALSAWLDTAGGGRTHRAGAQRAQSRFRCIGESRHRRRRRPRCRAAEQRYGGAGGVAAPAGGAGLCGSAHRLRVAVLQQCNDLQLSAR